MRVRQASHSSNVQESPPQKLSQDTRRTAGKLRRHDGRKKTVTYSSVRKIPAGDRRADVPWTLH